MMIFSVDVFAKEPLLSAEEQAMIEATAMQVNKAENSITYISPEDTNDRNINVYEKFNDVPEDTWYQSFLSHLVQPGVVRGVNETTFAPNEYVTGAQFVTMLAYAAEADLSLYAGMSSFMIPRAAICQITSRVWQKVLIISACIMMPMRSRMLLPGRRRRQI